MHHRPLPDTNSPPSKKHRTWAEQYSNELVRQEICFGETTLSFLSRAPPDQGPSEQFWASDDKTGWVCVLTLYFVAHSRSRWL
jgi:hypothetical protein